MRDISASGEVEVSISVGAVLQLGDGSSEMNNGTVAGARSRTAERCCWEIVCRGVYSLTRLITPFPATDQF